MSEEADIDKQLQRKLDQMLAARGIFINEQKNEEPKGAREKRLVDGVLLAAVGALGWALWTVNATVATLITANKYQDDAIANMRDDQKDTRADVRELQGKTFRGVPGYGEKEPPRATPRGR